MNRASARPGWRRASGTVILPTLLAPTAVVLTAAAGSRMLLPILATAALYPVTAYLIVRGHRAAALAATLLWAASLSAAVIALTVRDPAGSGDLVLRGTAYRDEMFAFIRTGTGRESDPAQFLLQHALHLGVFAVLAWISGGLFGVALGAMLIAYMSYYVGALAAAGGASGVAFLLGWPPWAILRVVAYAILGTALSAPALYAVVRRWPRSQLHRPAEGAGLPGTAWGGPWKSWYVAALVLLLADAALKALLAPRWALLLRPCLGAP
jgi:hypothetical protein